MDVGPWLLEEDARWIYDWAEPWILSDDHRTASAHGTPVVVFGEYAYDATPPWKRLVEDPLAATVDAGEIESALKAHAPLIAERAQQRTDILSGKKEVPSRRPGSRAPSDCLERRSDAVERAGSIRRRSRPAD